MSGYGNITTQKIEQLEKRLAELGVAEGELDEKFIKASGKGGQKVNKTSSCVHLRHRPSGIEVKCQKERSQAMNRYFARKELCERIEEDIKGRKSKKQQEKEKIRRQKRRRSRRSKQRMMDDKSKQSEKKDRRRSVRDSD